MSSSTPKPKSFRNAFLIATPDMGDPRFQFTVIYVVSHDRSGTMGIIINKDKDGLLISDLLDQVGISLTSTKDILESLVTDAHPKQALLAVGYAGWEAGQLEKEIAQNSWLVTDADEDMIFSADFEGKWATALSDMGIEPMSLSHGGGQA